MYTSGEHTRAITQNNKANGGKVSLLPRRTVLAMTVSLGMVMAGCAQQKSGNDAVYTDSVATVSPAESAPVVVMEPSADAGLYKSSSHASVPPMLPPVALENRDNYQDIKANPVHRTVDMAVATLSIDTDTGSYANVRRYLNEGQLPPPDAVRPEEMINYFNYQFTQAQRLAEAPFVVDTEVTQSPWDKAEQDNRIIKIGIKAVDQHWHATASEQMPPANLVFLVDVSGSMSSSDKLPLVKSSLKLLTQQMRAQDSISIVTYSGSTSVALPVTKGDQKRKIIAAINQLNAAGSTNGEDALKLAYDQAAQHMKAGGINRIIMLTDGDFNVGISSVDEMLDLVRANRDKGISLSTVGFGRGNLNDHMMEQMADNGNGNYSYIDGLSEAKKVFGDELAATFNTVAKDVKVQVEFNPNLVSEWRLIGYENRVLNEEYFNNDKVDAGELGAGKSVVALFEITPKGEFGLYSERRYGEANDNNANGADKQKKNELAYLKIRYKAPEGGASKLLSVPISNQSRSLADASAGTQFAIAVAGLAQHLSASEYVNDWDAEQSARLAQQSLINVPSSDLAGTRRDFINLAELAAAIQSSQ